MNEYKLADVEAKFADLIWQKEPVASPELVKLCEKELHWKKSTTYTVLKKLCDKGIFRNDDAVVTARISREQFYGRQSQRYVMETFGTLPQFLTAFFQEKKLSRQETEELKRYIDQFGE